MITPPPVQTSENTQLAKFVEIAFRDCLESSWSTVPAVDLSGIRKPERPKRSCLGLSVGHASVPSGLSRQSLTRLVNWVARMDQTMSWQAARIL
jgi:hypothetical protein